MKLQRKSGYFQSKISPQKED